MIGQKPQMIEFTPERWKHYKMLDGRVKVSRWMMVEDLTEIAQSGLFLAGGYATFEDYLRAEHDIAQKTYDQWKGAFAANEQAKTWGIFLKNQYAARALNETKEAARETVGRMAKAKAGDREVTARDIRNAANALMEAMDNVAAGDDVAALPALAEQSDREANQRTSMSIDKRQGWSEPYQYRSGEPLPPIFSQPGQKLELRWRVIE